MQQYLEIFKSYTAPYLERGLYEKDGNFELKYKHSFEVYENSRAICKSLTLEGEFAETVQVAALYHDTGRFPQYEKYGTFRDADSCNHGTLGVRTILREKLLDFMSPDARKTVLAAIALHNRRHIPDKLTNDKFITAAEIVRDSDKIDIIRILLHQMDNIGPASTVALMGLEDNPSQVSGTILTSLEHKAQANYLDMKCVNDFRLLVLSWAFDLNFPWSRQQMLQSGCVDRLFEKLPENSRITALYKMIIEQLNS
ncbi:HD domain-containing protein [Maridesulfovibrio sp.]|uniref:HD domain-containing protein n=1 Tax=Maridesulfovibrio sp. TaxID=2795000 RepID=UPI002A18BFC9|nr:HD domain-containing protein [Maridesulfovibrio sp.]